MNRKILRNPAQAFLQGRELGKAEGRQMGFDRDSYIQFLRFYNVNTELKIMGPERFKKFYTEFQKEKARLFNQEFGSDIDNVTTAIYHATETAQELGIDLSFEKMEKRAKNFEKSIKEVAKNGKELD